MRFDVHVHLAAEPPQGELSDRFRRALGFRLMRWALPPGRDPTDAYRDALTNAASHSTQLDGVVVLALDRPYSEVGLPLPAQLFVPNTTAAAACGRSPRLWLGASVHPYRPDALEALDEAVALGAVLCKWLPNVQGIDPASPLCRRFYVRLRELGLPLLSHTGDEHTLPGPLQRLGELGRLAPALAAGVTVIAAHAGCGGRTSAVEIADLCAREPRLFLECAALWTPHRFREMRRLLALPTLRDRWVYGSDYPVPVFWPWLWGSGSAALRAARAETNPFDRRVLAALALGVPREALTRGAALCRL